MKRILLMLLVLVSNQLLAQPCPNGFSATTQADLDNFTTLYPGCTSINGVLFISGDVQNLDALSQITQVNGNLLLGSINPDFDISGLSSLTTVGGNLDISSSLANLNGLENLTTVGQSVRISSCDNLSDLSVLNGIQNVGLDVEIINNALLTEINLFNTITTISGHVEISNNPLLENISGFNALSSIGAHLRIVLNTSLISLAGFSALETIGTYLVLSTNESLPSLTGLENLMSIGTYLNLTNNFVLSSIEALSNPISLGTYINFINNSQLSDCAVLAVCNAIANPDIQVSIQGNAPGCAMLSQVEDACNCEGQDLNYFASFSWCGPYTFLGQTFTESGTYEVPFTNNIGCSGVATLNLTLTDIDYVVTVVDSTFSVSGNFVNVTWLDCLNDFEPIVGAVFNTYEGSSTGSYAALLNAGACDVQTDCYQFIEVEDPANISNYENSPYRIYPNPSSGVIHFSSKTNITENVQVSVLNLYGQQVAAFHISDQTTSTDLSHLASGTYLFILSYTNGQTIDRVLITDK